MSGRYEQLGRQLRKVRSSLAKHDARATSVALRVFSRTAEDSLPAKVELSTPQESHIPRVSAGEASAPINSAGVRKMPTAIVWPTTSAVADPRPSVREAFGLSVKDPVAARAST